MEFQSWMHLKRIRNSKPEQNSKLKIQSEYHNNFKKLRTKTVGLGTKCEWIRPDKMNDVYECEIRNVIGMIEQVREEKILSELKILTTTARSQSCTARSRSCTARSRSCLRSVAKTQSTHRFTDRSVSIMPPLDLDHASLEMHPNSKSFIQDEQLNAIEVFKINNTIGSPLSPFCSSSNAERTSLSKGPTEKPPISPPMEVPFTVSSNRFLPSPPIFPRFIPLQFLDLLIASVGCDCECSTPLITGSGRISSQAPQSRRGS
ncbi:hypothetical protein LR48_Vigan07g086300 [Vigna angularis]|uniref:Uncharacterized protein n=1 Tax=Phaseolus angularis TaxID=3914 RepID=A0A0L9UX83_PHAAN|nr:hypothetical protein LR48_Vigan07g086300 [Vigna angularis]